MSYDLRWERWIPFRRKSGVVEWGPPWMLTDDLDGNPVVAIAAPRPDFSGALQEFLIGLLAVSLRPDDESAWREWWNAPPSPDRLRKALAALPAAFSLDGDGPRFLQDLTVGDFAVVKPGPIDRMLIDSPGEQGIQLNKDLFVKRERVSVLGRPAAAMALLTMQSYAPAGGQGFRTSMRGGGPLTTLIEPRAAATGASLAHEQPLWMKLWVNVETVQQWEQRFAAEEEVVFLSAQGGSSVSEGDAQWWRVFPWLAPTRTSEGDRCLTAPVDGHPLQAYFGMPRRIRLDFGGVGVCDLVGAIDEVTVTAFRARNLGVKYVAWRHPLTPYYLSAQEEWLPVHGQPDGIGWRDWLGLTMRQPEGGRREPSLVIGHLDQRRSVLRRHGDVRLHAFGYDMDNMKARGWVEAELPLIIAPDVDSSRLLAEVARRMTDGGGIAALALSSAIKHALHAKPDEVRGDASAVLAGFWEGTMEAFYAVLRAVAAMSTEDRAADDVLDAHVVTFLAEVERVATVVFDRYAPMAGAPPQSARRIVVARHDLLMTLRGNSKFGQKLFAALGRPTPTVLRANRDSSKRGRPGVTSFKEGSA